MTDKHGKFYVIKAIRGNQVEYHKVRGGGKGIRLVEQLEAEGWSCSVRQERSDKRQVTRRRDYDNED